MAKSDSLMRAGHRERLRKKFEAGNASDADEMELLLTYVIQRRDVRVPSRLLTEEFKCPYNAMLADPDQLAKIEGVGPGVITFFKLLRSIVTKGYQKLNKEESLFGCDKKLHDYCRIEMAHKTTEEMRVMYLDTIGRVLCEEVNDIGTVNKSNVYYDKILARALITGASHVVLFHNHPVGACLPSVEDADTTIKLGKMLLQHGIRLQDHLIVGTSGAVFSMRNAGHLMELDIIEARMKSE